MREIRADWEKIGQIRRSPGAGGRCFLAIIRVYFIASAIFLRNCLVPSHALERPATHAAAGAAARGVRGIGGFFLTPVCLVPVVRRICCESMCGHAAPATTGVMARGRRFLFFQGCSWCGAGALLRLFRGRLREWGEVVDAREWSFGAVPPQSDGTRVKALWFFGGGFGGFRTGRAGWRGRRSRGLPA